MLNREIMKKTITDLKNNKEFLKKERKIEKYDKWIDVGHQEVLQLSAIPAALTATGGPAGFGIYGIAHSGDDTARMVALAGAIGCIGAAFATGVAVAVTETYLTSCLPEKQEKLRNEINNAIKHNYVKNGVLEYYQQKGLSQNEATEKFNTYCKEDLVKGIPSECNYGYDQFDKDMAEYIEQNHGFNYNEFAVLEDTSEMAE